MAKSFVTDSWINVMRCVIWPFNACFCVIIIHVFECNESCFIYLVIQKLQFRAWWVCPFRSRFSSRQWIISNCGQITSELNYICKLRLLNSRPMGLRIPQLVRQNLIENHAYQQYMVLNFNHIMGRYYEQRIWTLEYKGARNGGDIQESPRSGYKYVYQTLEEETCDVILYRFL